jgi:hypothetical protein
MAYVQIKSIALYLHIYLCTFAELNTNQDRGRIIYLYIPHALVHNRGKKPSYLTVNKGTSSHTT